MGAAAPKLPHAIHPHSKLWGILAFSHEGSIALPTIQEAIQRLLQCNQIRIGCVAGWEFLGA